MWFCFLPVAAEVGGVDPLTIEVRLMNEVVLWYFLYCGLGHVDLEGALGRFYFISIWKRESFRGRLGCQAHLLGESLTASFCATTCCHLKFARALRPYAV